MTPVGPSPWEEATQRAAWAAIQEELPFNVTDEKSMRPRILQDHQPTAAAPGRRAQGGVSAASPGSSQVSAP